MVLQSQNRHRKAVEAADLLGQALVDIDELIVQRIPALQVPKIGIRLFCKSWIVRVEQVADHVGKPSSAASGWSKRLDLGSESGPISVQNFVVERSEPLTLSATKTSRNSTFSSFNFNPNVKHYWPR